MTKDIEREALIAEIDHFISEAKKSYIVERWAVSYENSNPFSHTINDKNEVWWMKAQAHQLWQFWQAAKAHEAKKLEGCVVVPVESLNKTIDAIEDMFEDDPTLALGELLPIQQDIKAILEAARGGNE
ncbi:hypothetical protein AYL20_01465 [Acinetobacter venetianus]|uniref:hypothetical protein n=1 Tax=Acinetobacter venetianus TaxID=52133 RepID=UPI000775875F|nr:hypothetical protein [Acinetobacter venetianus]KXO82692.1 hypothetical protein AYL20_01465 [Acinetobacter venetianus]